MFFLVYTSSAVTPFSQAELLDLLAESRRNNADLGVTGMLLYRDGNFMQVLEGEEAAVRKIFSIIMDDRRHRGIIILLQGQREERHFPEWSMGFRDLNSPEVRATPGFSTFLNTPLTGEEFSADPSRCQRLLLAFKECVR